MRLDVGAVKFAQCLKRGELDRHFRPHDHIDVSELNLGCAIDVGTEGAPQMIPGVDPGRRSASREGVQWVRHVQREDATRQFRLAAQGLRGLFEAAYIFGLAYGLSPKGVTEHVHGFQIRNASTVDVDQDGCARREVAGSALLSYQSVEPLVKGIIARTLRGLYCLVAEGHDISGSRWANEGRKDYRTDETWPKPFPVRLLPRCKYRYQRSRYQRDDLYVLSTLIEEKDPSGRHVQREKEVLGAYAAQQSRQHEPCEKDKVREVIDEIAGQREDAPTPRTTRRRGDPNVRNVIARRGPEQFNQQHARRGHCKRQQSRFPCAAEEDEAHGESQADRGIVDLEIERQQQQRGHHRRVPPRTMRTGPVSQDHEEQGAEHRPTKTIVEHGERGAVRRVARIERHDHQQQHEQPEGERPPQRKPGDDHVEYERCEDDREERGRDRHHGADAATGPHAKSGQ